MNTEEVLQRYARIVASSEQMLVAAEQGRWDDLIALESARRALVVEVTTMATPTLATSSREQKETMIHRVLAIDERVRGLTETWMTEIKTLLTSVQAERKLVKAYDLG